jgi:hypothetical protein
MRFDFHVSELITPEYFCKYRAEIYIYVIHITFKEMSLILYGLSVNYPDTLFG